MSVITCAEIFVLLFKLLKLCCAVQEEEKQPEPDVEHAKTFIMPPKPAMIYRRDEDLLLFADEDEKK